METETETERKRETESEWKRERERRGREKGETERGYIKYACCGIFLNIYCVTGIIYLIDILAFVAPLI